MNFQAVAKSSVLGQQKTLKDLTIGTLQVLGFAVLTAIAAKVQFYLPISPVPITLQSAIVLLAGAALGWKKGAASQVVLIALGLAGLPVFSKPIPGFLVLAGPTGGYIIGFVLAAAMAGWILHEQKVKGFWKEFFAVFVASLYIFLPGMVWLGMFLGFEWSKIFVAGFAIHMPGDVVKCIAVVLTLKAYQAARNSF